LVDTDTTALNGGTKIPISGRVISALMVGEVVEMVTPIFDETGMAMAASTVVDTLAPTEGADACVNCAYEEDCDDCNDAEAPKLVDLVIVFKVLPLLRCMDKMQIFPHKKFTKNSC